MKTFTNKKVFLDFAAGTDPEEKAPIPRQNLTCDRNTDKETTGDLSPKNEEL